MGWFLRKIKIVLFVTSFVKPLLEDPQKLTNTIHPSDMG